MSQEQAKKTGKADEKKDDEPVASGQGQGRGESDKKVEQVKKDLDSLLDEIDEVLEENAEEFVKSYRQRGGE